jgi:hypothetical protein
MEKLFLTVVAENGKKFVIECDQNGNPSEGTGTLVGSKRQRTPVDSEKMDAAQQVAHAVTPAWRLEQMFDLANDTINGAVPDIRNIGAYLKLVNADILKEESDVIAEAGLIPKDIYPAVAKIAREFYKDALDDIVMG